MSGVSAYLTQVVQSAAAPSNEQLDAALANLADISVGATPSIWPLAWGWWVLATLVLALVTGIVWFIVKYIRKHRFKRHALKAIADMRGDEAITSENLAKLHAILRSAIIHYFPNETINGLQGAAWQQFLHSQTRDGGKAEQRYLSDLVQLEASLYTKEPSITMTNAKQAVSSWIGNCLPPSSSSTSTHNTGKQTEESSATPQIAPEITLGKMPDVTAQTLREEAQETTQKKGVQDV